MTREISQPFILTKSFKDSRIFSEIKRYLSKFSDSFVIDLIYTNKQTTNNPMGKVKDAAMVANATSQAMVEKKKLKSKIVLFKHDEMETARIENAKRKIEKAKM